MNSIRKKYKAFSLAELIIAVAIFGLISAFLTLLVVDSTRAYENTYARSKATSLVKEIYSTLKLLKTDNWFEVTKHTGLGPKHLIFEEGEYKIADGEKVEGLLTYFFTVDLAQRDTDGKIVEEGGNTDAHTRVISVNIKWKDRVGKEHVINPKLYLNDWHVNTFTFTSMEDFQPGGHTDTTASESFTGGELRLQSVFYPNWCRPERSMSSYDIPGEAYAKSIFAEIGYAYLGTRGGDVVSLLKKAAHSTQSNLIYILFLAFLAGIVTSFTPCIYPMIPITVGILQSQASNSLTHNFFSALSYVFGIALVYAGLGYASATTSLIFGKWLASPFFIFLIILFFLYLAFSMFGFYEIYMPRFLTHQNP